MINSLFKKINVALKKKFEVTHKMYLEHEI